MDPNQCFYMSVRSKLDLPTIETCFNCFGTRSSDAKIIKKTTIPPGQFKSYAESHDPPPLAGEWESPRWRQCLKETNLILYQICFTYNCTHSPDGSNHRHVAIKDFPPSTLRPKRNFFLHCHINTIF